ncbi:Vegetative incompatibility protein HET-E-1 [Cladobotryum mycophilum]|uniref:Vegetative incompatibility protein HET-E-1 n=1 Tax=Cladobotryum mycophilum TaxID=491253 RepID=A0ABR0SRA0_9HYPO
MDDDEDVSLCKQILTVVATVYRPVALHELYSLIGRPDGFFEDITDVAPFQEVINLCGSFLTIRGDTIYFVHQSAKDHLTMDRAWAAISSSSFQDIHYTMFSQSLQVMNDTLRRDIYNLSSLGYHIDQVQQPNPDPLAAVMYLCIYWIDHLQDCSPSQNVTEVFEEGGLIDMFLHYHFLHWLEALSLLRSVSKGILSITRLKDLLAEQMP